MYRSLLSDRYLVKLFAMKKMQTVHRGVRAGPAGIAVVSPDLPPVAGGKEGKSAVTSLILIFWGDYKITNTKKETQK
ncbi:MAG: hypothetical protein DSY57_02330 [Desulfobulbus sp.]|nr:MAG: hypothetical protein DSY57_02330 [Desulfobulbus sp.]